jgi:hypothetical protein
MQMPDLKTYKIYTGVITDISEAQVGLYRVEYICKDKKISDWLYCSEECDIGKDVLVMDGKIKKILSLEDIENFG